MSAPEVIKLAILAVGGQGGGVLTGWLVALAEANGWRVQSTVVAGVAQRTGATIYYLEMAAAGERAPVFALAPAAGDVDILIAAELMEAGRAVMRGFVTPDRTTLIASTPPHPCRLGKDRAGRRAGTGGGGLRRHGDGREAAHHGGLSAGGGGRGLGDLGEPLRRHRGLRCAAFPAREFRGRDQGVRPRRGREPSGLRGRRSGRYPRARRAGTERGGAARPGPPAGAMEHAGGPPRQIAGAGAEMAEAGLRHVVDFQDPAYGTEYLDRLDRVVAADGGDYAFSIAAAKYIANAMAYDDVIRVADLKTRRTRFDRVRREMGLDAGDVAHITEFMRPRVEELCSVMPAWLGGWIEARPRLARWIDRRVNRGRRVRTGGVLWFGALYLLAAAKRWRRGMLRHRVETAHLERWLALAVETAQHDRALAVEIVACRRLIKGYSDTHARGEAKFDKVLAALPMLAGRVDAADWLRRLREAALRDEKGEALEGALKTVASFATKEAA